MKTNKLFLAAMVFVLSPMLMAAPPKAKVSLVGSVDGVVAGSEFEVGVRFELEKDWHIYWINSGDSGLPPRVVWKNPDGFSVGELSFPVPKRHHSPGDIVTNILVGTPMLVGAVTAPSGLSGDSVTLSAKVLYLICNDKCLREEAEVSVTLPVLAAGGEAGEANRKLFKRARRAAPKATSKHVSVKAAGSPASLLAGAKFDVAVTIDIKRGFHIQSNKPTMPSLIGADIFLEPSEGVEFGEAVFPKAHFREVANLGKLSEFEGEIVVHVPGEVDSERGGDPVRVAGVLRYQACTNKGQCMPPAGISFEWFSSAKGSGSGAPVAVEKLADSDGAGAEVSGPAAIEKVAAGGGDGVVASDEKTLEVAATGSDEEGLEAYLKGLGPVGLLFGCFLYGLFINATPCVLPLLSIKVLGFVQQAHESRGRAAALGLSFGVGVVVFFVLIGLIAAQGDKTNVLQFPVVVIGLGGVVMALALSMLGVFTLQVPTAASSLEGKIQSEGLAASFGKGALAPVLGLACTGPLLAGAWAWATQQPSTTAILAFLATGIGMASPYVLLGFNPKWLSFLPRPGNWMITFERVMGFMLLGMVVYLIHPLTVQIGSEGLEWTLVFYVGVGLACWIMGKVQITMATGTRWRYRGGAALTALLAGILVYGMIFPLGPAVERQRAILRGGGSGIHVGASGIAWRSWSREAVDEVVRGGRVAFVDFTSAYCTQCKVNKKVAIETQDFAKKLEEVGGVAFRGDFTLNDDDIADVLDEFNSPGVPLNLVFPAGRPDHPIQLRTQLTKSYLLEKLDEAVRIGDQTASVGGF